MASDSKPQKPMSTATVTLTLEIDVDSTWGDDCTVGQVYDQASSGARGTIRNMIHKANENPNKIRIVGEPKIDALIAPRGY